MQAVGPDSFGAVRANLIWLLQKLRSVIYATYEESAHMDQRSMCQELYMEAVEDVARYRDALGTLKSRIRTALMTMRDLLEETA